MTVAPLKTISLRRTVPVVGTLHAFEDVALAPKVDGRVLRILKDVGDTVLPGEVLLELDPTDYELAVGQARPAFEAELRKLKLDALPETDVAFAAHLPKVDAVAQADANLELAKKELARTEFENSKGVGATQLLDAAKTKVKVAEAGLELARTDARVTLANARKLKAALDDAQERLRETELRAPTRPEWAAWSAVVGSAANPLRYSVAHRMVSKGEMIRQMPVTNAFRLVLDHTLKLRVTVPEKFKPEVHIGQSVAVRVEAYPNRVFGGAVSRVNPTVDAVNRTFMVEIEVPNYDRALERRRLRAGRDPDADRQRHPHRPARGDRVVRGRDQGLRGRRRQGPCGRSGDRYAREGMGGGPRRAQAGREGDYVGAVAVGGRVGDSGAVIWRTARRQPAESHRPPALQTRPADAWPFAGSSHGHLGHLHPPAGVHHHARARAGGARAGVVHAARRRARSRTSTCPSSWSRRRCAGASVEEMESRVTKPVEEAVNTVSGIDELRSTTREGVSTVVIGFKLEKNGDIAAQDVRDKVSTLLPRLPFGTDPPVVEKFNLDAAPGGDAGGLRRAGPAAARK